MRLGRPGAEALTSRSASIGLGDRAVQPVFVVDAVRRGLAASAAWAGKILSRFPRRRNSGAERVVRRDLLWKSAIWERDLGVLQRYLVSPAPVRRWCSARRFRPGPGLVAKR